MAELTLRSQAMAPWFWYAVAAAVLYGAHQIFTRLASDHIGDGIGGFVVEATAALSILLYLAFLWVSGRWNQKFGMPGFNYSVLTGICVGAGTIAFFLLFQKGGPLSAVRFLPIRFQIFLGCFLNFAVAIAALRAQSERRLGAALEAPVRIPAARFEHLPPGPLSLDPRS